MDIVSALRRICEDSKELETLCKRKALRGKLRSVCRSLSREFEAVLTEVEAAQREQGDPPVQWYETAMLFLREALAIRYDQAHYRKKECSSVAIIHASWLESGQLFATGCADNLSSTTEENGHSFGKALGPAAKKTLALVCSHVFEESPPRTPARLLIEDSRAVKDKATTEPQDANVISLKM